MSKPPYRVPLVAETALEPRNGLTVASTFSGGGGSCYGYELAGCTVGWANEMVAESRDTYRVNHPGTILDPRDIRQVQPQDVLDALGLRPGELDLLDGSPPCQSFSLAGSRTKGWGKKLSHADGTEQVSDDLFFEFARLLKDLQPKTFVAENVKGMVIGAAKGQFKRILVALKVAGYRVEARLLDASWLGVPQARQRLIFVGVRDDLGMAPVFPRPLPYQYTLRDALPELDAQDYLAMQFGPKNPIHRSSVEEPAPTVMASGMGGVGSHQLFLNTDQPRRLSIAELRRVCGFPDDYVLTGTYAQQWARLGNAVPPPMTAAVASVLRDAVLLPARNDDGTLPPAQQKRTITP